MVGVALWCESLSVVSAGYCMNCLRVVSACGWRALGPLFPSLSPTRIPSPSNILSNHNRETIPPPSRHDPPCYDYDLVKRSGAKIVFPGPEKFRAPIRRVTTFRRFFFLPTLILSLPGLIDVRPIHDIGSLSSVSSPAYLRLSNL